MSTPAGIRPPTFRLPESAHVGAVRYQVADLERSLWFYRDLVGLRLIDRRDSDGSPRARLGAAGGRAVLLELVEKKGARPVPRSGRLGLYHSALLLPTRAALGSFIAHLHAAGFPAGSADHSFSEAMYLRDPDGITLEVYADRPRAEWVIRDREIVGTLDPLDTAALVALAGGSPWTGVPAGSVIGHVHFYVGDLDEAATFYHGGLGLDKVGWSLPGALFMSAGGYHHHVGANTWLAGAPVATAADARLLEWELVLPDQASVEGTAESLGRAGYPIAREATDARATDAWGIAVKITVNEAKGQ
jgi:catechol 2,3-dioxygenase